MRRTLSTGIKGLALIALFLFLDRFTDTTMMRQALELVVNNISRATGFGDQYIRTLVIFALSLAVLRVMTLSYKSVSSSVRR